MFAFPTDLEVVYQPEMLKKERSENSFIIANSVDSL